VLAGLVVVGVFVQAAAIAYGWFQALNQVDDGLVIDKNYDGNAGHTVHGIVGMYVIPLIGLVFLIVSFMAARVVPGARKWAGIVFGLIVLQVVLAFLAFSVPAIGALHGINALAIIGTSMRAIALTRTPAGAENPSTPEAPLPV
jgi:heme A synthase